MLIISTFFNLTIELNCRVCKPWGVGGVVPESGKTYQKRDTLFKISVWSDTSRNSRNIGGHLVGPVFLGLNRPEASKKEGPVYIWVRPVRILGFRGVISQAWLI